MGLLLGVTLEKTNYISKAEFIVFLAGTFLYTNMVGMVGNFRQAYLVNVLQLQSSDVSMINIICGVTGYLLSFFYAIMIDRPPKPGKNKFKPLVSMSAIPCGIFCVLMFVTPDLPYALMMAYLCIVVILYGASTAFGNTINMTAVVMTPNNRERDKLLSFRGIANAIGNSAPLVVVLVVGQLRKPGIIRTEEIMYIVSAVACAVVGSFSMLIAMRVVKERTVYNPKRENPLLGFKEILKNKYALLVLLSEFLKNFRSIATYMGIFLAAALLGDTSKYLLFGLPTGIGTFVGMLIVNALLKKFNSKQIYIASGIYSIFANSAAFGVGVWSFNNPDNMFIQILFFVFLFLIGLQFGASNLLPSMFQADILEDLEVKTRKRLDACLNYVISSGSAFSGLIGGALAPIILYGENSIIKYIPPAEEIIDGAVHTIYTAQTYSTKVSLLAFYTIFHGLMMLLAGLPFLLYKLVGPEKERVHEEVLKIREDIKDSDAQPDILAL